MKFGKVVLIVLGVVVLGIAFGYLYMTYNRQLDEQAQLKAKITANQASVAKLVAERDGVQAQLAQLNQQLDAKRSAAAAAKASLDNVTASWPKSAESIEYDEQIFTLAAGWDLDITVANAGEPAPQTIQGIGFVASKFDVSVVGQPITSSLADASEYQSYVYQVVGNILGFIDALAADKSFSTAKIEIVSITVPPLLTTDQVVAAGVKLAQPTAKLSVSVYTYRGG